MSIVGGGKARVEKAKTRGRAREALDHEWMRKHRQGKSAVEIAEAEGVSKRTVQLALARVKAAEQAAQEKAERDAEEKADGDGSSSSPVQRPWWLELVPLFPIGAFTPSSKCPHHGPIREGSLLCCMVCSTSGIDDHPALRRDPKTDPKPEPRPHSGPLARKPASPPAKGPGPTPLPEPAAGRETRKERRRRQFEAAGRGEGA